MRRNEIKEFFKNVYLAQTSPSKLLLREQEEEDAGDEGGEVEEDAEEVADEEDAESGEPTPDDQEGKTDEEKFHKSFDNQLDALFVDIESGAIDAAQQQQESLSLKQLLLIEAEDEAAALDIEHFASETARIMKNADSFIDLEQTIFNKAKDFLIDKYGEDVVSQFEEIMDFRYDVESDENKEAKKLDVDLAVPLAVTGLGGGAA